MKTSSCNANIFSKHQDIQKYIPLEITRGEYLATTKNPYDQPIQNYEANIELNDKTIGTFFTQWYFYYGDQFGMNFFNLKVKDNIEQLPLGKEGDVFLKVTKIGDDYMLTTCDENGKLDNNYSYIEKKYFHTLENSDLKQYVNEDVSFIIKKGHVMKDETGKEIEVDGKNFFTADFYRINDQTKPIGELYCDYGIHVNVDDHNFSGFYYHYLPTMKSVSISDEDNTTLALFNGSSNQHPYFFGLIHSEAGALSMTGIGHLDKIENVEDLFNTEKSVCQNPHNNTAFNAIPESFAADFIYM